MTQKIQGYLVILLLTLPALAFKAIQEHQPGECVTNNQTIINGVHFVG